MNGIGDVAHERAVTLIVNPVASRARGRFLHEAVEALATWGRVDVRPTTRSGHAGQIARQCTARQDRLLAVMGGDGTANDVAQAVAGTRTAIIVLPSGSTNVFARAVGWSQRRGHAAAQLRAAMADPVLRTLTLGRATLDGTHHLFILNAGIGIDAQAVETVEAHPWAKHALRQGAFALAIVASAARFSHRATPLAVTVDDGNPFELASLVAACGAPYAYLGPLALDLAPGAQFDGRLRWLGITRPRLRSVGLAVGGALAHARHIGHGDTRSGWVTRTIHVVAPVPVPVQVDGEPMGAHREIAFSAGPAVTVLVPPTPPRRGSKTAQS